MNKVELIFEGPGKKNIRINKITVSSLVLVNTINGRSVLESADKFK